MQNDDFNFKRSEGIIGYRPFHAMITKPPGTLEAIPTEAKKAPISEEEPLLELADAIEENKRRGASKR